MNVHVLLYLSNKVKKKDKMRVYEEHSVNYFATNVINSLIQEHEY